MDAAVFLIVGLVLLLWLASRATRNAQARGRAEREYDRRDAEVRSRNSKSGKQWKEGRQ